MYQKEENVSILMEKHYIEKEDVSNSVRHEICVVTNEVKEILNFSP